MKRVVKRSPKSHYRHMNREKAERIRRRYFAREANQAQLAREHNLSISTISRIVSGLVWS